MKKTLLLGSLALLFALTILLIGGFQPAKAASAQPNLDTDQVERGRYLAHRVGMCIDCHSPRGPDGQFIEDRHLTGAPLPFVATVPMPWAPVAPNLAGLPVNYTRESLIHFLMTGERPHGLPPPLPPMPPVRLNEEDASALAVYLESLGATPRKQ